jgi:hypothetical protein
MMRSSFIHSFMRTALLASNLDVAATIVITLHTPLGYICAFRTATVVPTEDECRVQVRVQLVRCCPGLYNTNHVDAITNCSMHNVCFTIVATHC